MALNEQRFIGENRLTKVNMYADLEAGQTALSVVWTMEAGSGITLVALSNDVVLGQEGVLSVVRGRFDYSAAIAGTWTLTATVTCQNPTEVKVAYVLVLVSAVPL